jgi:hypothetical protein
VINVENPYNDAIEHYTERKERTEESIKNMHIVLLAELSDHFDKIIFLRKRLRYRFGIYDYLDKNIFPAGYKRFYSYLHKKRDIKKAIKKDVNEINSLAEQLQWYKDLILKYRKLSEQFESLQCINDKEKIDELMSKIDHDYLAVKMHWYYG